MNIQLYTALACLLLAIGTLGSPADVAPEATNFKKPGKCPAPTKCYKDTISPPCLPGRMCSMMMQEVVACQWSCGQTPPVGCTERCQPCKAEVCIAVCICEIVCSAINSCTAAGLPPN